jgi:2-polyprenyl-3-methyl-5-hydroxy-6-metoxy-1,4-benzoquinol methylase
MRYYVRDLLNDAPTQEPASRVFWEEVCCPLCGGERYRPLLEAQEGQGGTGMWFGMVQCNKCGLCFTNPRPVADSLPQFYRPDYSCHRPRTRLGESAVRRRFLPRLRRWRPPFPWQGDGRLLDFACGGGRFLARMKEYHWQVTGIDLSSRCVARAREATGLRILVGTLPHPELDPNSFDVITMWHALEHVADPRQVLVEARKLLTWNGKLVVTVPNLDSLAFRIFGAHWYGLDLPRHLTHFTPRTLRLLMERAGFRVHSIRVKRHSAWLRHSAHTACGHPPARWLHGWLRTKAVSRLVAGWAHLTRQSDAIMAIATPAVC